MHNILVIIIHSFQAKSGYQSVTEIALGVFLKNNHLLFIVVFRYSSTNTVLPAQPKEGANKF